jgi:hypothetical protein
LAIVIVLKNFEVGLDSRKCHPPLPFAWFTLSAILRGRIIARYVGGIKGIWGALKT